MSGAERGCRRRMAKNATAAKTGRHPEAEATPGQDHGRGKAEYGHVCVHLTIIREAITDTFVDLSV